MRQALRRKAVQPQLRSKRKTHLFPAPVRGWVLSEPLAASQPGGAKVLDNWFPTQTGIRLRGGSVKYATIDDGGGAVESMFVYKVASTEKLFAADESGNVFNLTTVADADVVPDPVVANQTSGYYATAQFGTSGGDFMYCVNGDDDALLYDGTDFWRISSTETYGLAYDAETGNFTVGETVTGGTSGATATIVDIVDNGTDGTLYIKSITGTFQNDETITDGSTGSATSDIPSGVTTEQSAVITGVSTALLSHVWVYKSRLFFVEKNTLRAWCLPVDAIGGAATEISLKGVLQGGGSLLFGATWSLDAGDGIDDKCVFVSTTGEVAIYEGTDPSDADAWSLVGVYNITPPLGMKAVMRAGGDLVIATKSGFVPLSTAIDKDPAALSLSAVSRPIESAWLEESAARDTVPWEVVKAPEYNLAIVSLPVVSAAVDAYCFVVNIQTGAWCRYTQWDTQCLALFNKSPYFGTSGGVVFLGESGGSDNGSVYTASYAGLGDHVSSPGQHKTLHSIRSIFELGAPANYKVSASVNYAINFPAAPSSVDDYAVDTWDVGQWDEAVWDQQGEVYVDTRWHSVGKSGFIVHPQIQCTSGVTPTPTVELVSLELVYETGKVMV